MLCSLCEKPIENYNEQYNQLELNNSKKVYLCEDCIQKIMHWRQEILTKLFPTTGAKKWLNKKK